MRLTIEPTDEDSGFSKVVIETAWDHENADAWIDDLLKPALLAMGWDTKLFFPTDDTNQD